MSIANIFYYLLCIIKNISVQRKNDKILFLDFDGVLATEDYTDRLLAVGKDTKDKYGTLFNPDCAKFLESIVIQTHAKIVVTSSWRNYLSQLSIKRMWRYRNMPGEIIGITPSISIYRGVEIDNWLSKHPEVRNYVIIDDMDYKQFEQKHICHLVTTNHFSGLDKTSADVSVKILNQYDTK